MEQEFCYRKFCDIDGRLCTSIRFSFCDPCRQAQRENADEIKCTKTPLDVTAAHIPPKDRK